MMDNVEKASNYKEYSGSSFKKKKNQDFTPLPFNKLHEDFFQGISLFYSITTVGNMDTPCICNFLQHMTLQYNISFV
jgi:hypothetical protein